MDKHTDRNTSEAGSSVFRRMILSQNAGDIAFDEENVPCNTPRNSVHLTFGGSSGKMAASSRGDCVASVSSGEYVRDPGSILSLQPWIFRRSGPWNKDEKMFASGSRTVGKCKHQMDGLAHSSAVEVSPRSTGLGSGPGRGRGALRSKRSRRHLIKPLVSTENSFIPQLYNENFEIEECMLGPFPSPATARPFIVTDGRRVINKSSYELLPVPFDTGFCKEGCRDGTKMVENVVGVSPLPEQKKSKLKSREMLHGILGMPGSHRTSKPSKSTGLLNQMLVFSTGVSIGVLASSLSNKKEVDILKATLKRTENLVQDLHEELEMKESLTVKELPDENSGGREDKNSQAHVAKSEPMSQIEVELEAELKRLELNMTSNSLERQISDLNEVDQEFVGDIVQGELKVDMAHHVDYSSESGHVRDSKESSPECLHESNYPVSPRELSLRLHKVIQHRLEDRIKELEAALSQSQKQLQMQAMEPERVFSERTCSNSDPDSSSNQESPVFIQETSSLVQPFCLTLAGDALDAYGEAYEEFMRVADSPYTTSSNGKPHRNEEYLDNNLIWGLEDENAMKLKRVPTWERILKSRELSGARESDGDEECESDDDDNNDDAESKLLIQQIVERTKQGSPVLLHAQRLLFSVDD